MSSYWGFRKISVTKYGRWIEEEAFYCEGLHEKYLRPELWQLLVVMQRAQTGFSE